MKVLLPEFLFLENTKQFYYWINSGRFSYDMSEVSDVDPSRRKVLGYCSHTTSSDEVVWTCVPHLLLYKPGGNGVIAPLRLVISDV